jgi:hypothetical protein
MEFAKRYHLLEEPQKLSRPVYMTLKENRTMVCKGIIILMNHIKYSCLCDYIQQFSPEVTTSPEI